MFKYIGPFPIKLKSLPSKANHARLLFNKKSLLKNFDHSLSSIYSLYLRLLYNPNQYMDTHQIWCG